MEDDLQWKKTFVGGRPLVEKDLEPNIGLNIEPNILKEGSQLKIC